MTQAKSRAEIELAVERLTGTKIDLEDERVRGRNIWGRVAFNQAGMLHVEILPRDKAVNDAVMPTISKDDMQLGRASRREIYQKLCQETASAMNSRAIESNNLTLLVSSNAHPTRNLKALIETLLPKPNAKPLASID